MTLLAACFAASAIWCAGPAPPRGRWRRLTGRAHIRWRPSPVAIAIAALTVTGSLFFGPAIGVPLGLLAVPFVLPPLRAFAQRDRRRRNDLVGAQSPLAFDLIAAALAAGRPPSVAFAVVAASSTEPLRSELMQVARRLDVAVDHTAVWNQLADGPLSPVGRAFERAESSGFAVARVVGDAAAELRRKDQGRRREAAARLAISTTIPLALCFLPAFLLSGVVPLVIGLTGQLLP